MVALYDINWNMIDVFPNRPTAMMYAVENGISPYKIEDL